MILQSTRLTTISFPNCLNISSFAFYGCTNLNEVVLPTCKCIEQGVFIGCTQLSIVKLYNCSQIQFNAFVGCNLMELYLIESSIPTLWSSKVFDGTPLASGVGSIYVPASLIEDYKIATNWSYFSSRFIGI